jgi:hypothetical protein
LIARLLPLALKSHLGVAQRIQDGDRALDHGLQGDVQLLRVMPAPIAYCRLCGTMKRISAVGLCTNDL